MGATQAITPVRVRFSTLHGSQARIRVARRADMLIARSDHDVSKPHRPLLLASLRCQRRVSALQRPGYGAILWRIPRCFLREAEVQLDLGRGTHISRSSYPAWSPTQPPCRGPGQASAVVQWRPTPAWSLDSALESTVPSRKLQGQRTTIPSTAHRLRQPRSEPCMQGAQA